MKFRRFFELLILVAIVAAIYAPPIQMALESRLMSSATVSPSNLGWSGTSLFASLARDMGYRVVLTNSTIEDLRGVEGKALYVLMGPDQPLTAEEVSAVGSMMKSGELSILMAQGNMSNNHFFSSLLGFNITGRPIIDPASPFEDKRVTAAEVTLDGGHRVLLNVASPMVKVGEGVNEFHVEPIGLTGEESYDVGNETRGARVVAVAINSEDGLSGIVVSDSGIFINSALNSTEISGARRLAAEAIDQLTRGDKQTTIVIDDAHYDKLGTGPQIPFTLPPLGMLLAIFMISYLKTFNQTYDAFLASTPFSMLLLLSGLALVGTYFGLRRWMGRQPVGVDTPDMPIIESERLVESTSRVEIATLKTSGRFYLDTLARLYYVLDELVKREFGVSIDSVDGEAAGRITDRIGRENFERLIKTARDLGKIREKT
ncbi:MAG: DUF4350 domain-containing protein, partial [Nitrososphaerales archaeon]